MPTRAVWTALIAFQTAMIQDLSESSCTAALVRHNTEQSHLSLQLWRVKPRRIYSDWRASNS